MKRQFWVTFLLANVVAFYSFAGQSIWQLVSNEHVNYQGERKLFPSEYVTYSLNSSLLQTTLLALPTDYEYAQAVNIPTPDGSYRTFMLWQSPMMEGQLAEKYSQIKTFTGYAADDKFTTIKADVTYQGFHAMIFDGESTYFIDPFSNVNDGYYICYYKTNYPRPAGKSMECMVGSNDGLSNDKEMYLTENGLPQLAYRTNGTVKRTYRLALACTYEYAVAVAGTNLTKANVLSAMVTSMNRVNGVYERELALTMNLVSNTDTLIYITSSDPYSNSNPNNLLTENQTNIDNLIGSANYDIGHVFSTAGGGLAMLGSACQSSDKAGGETGTSSPLGDPFDIDYVAHEMGHQYGANHTFNANTGSCAGNGYRYTAYEPGSGSTIMAYAGICGSSDNLQNHSNDYFHAISLKEMTDYITSGVGSTCPAQTAASNVPPVVAAFTATYSIPYLTPFELIAPTVTDTDHDVLKYCWEEWNLGDYKSSWANTNLHGPIFRSFSPTTSDTRTFVSIDNLVFNNISYLGEKLPTDARVLTFKLTVRDMVGSWGTFNTPDDTIHLDVINTGTPFAVTYPNGGMTWAGGSSQTVTWDVASTDVSPINTANVDILLSTDGGYTYPVTILSNTPNDGSETITVPSNVSTTYARLKVKAVGNVFFDISDDDFTITKGTSVKNVSWDNAVSIYPNPVKDVLNIQSTYQNRLKVNILNTIGQNIWTGDMDNNSETIIVKNWAKGVYYVQLMDMKTNEKTVKKFVVE